MGCMILRAIDVWFKMVDTLKGDKHAEHQSSFTLAISQPPNHPAIACLLAYDQLPAMSKLGSPWSTREWTQKATVPFLSPSSLANSSLKTPCIHEAIGMRFFTWNIRLALSICQDLVAGSSSWIWNPYNELMDLAVSHHNVQVLFHRLGSPFALDFRCRLPSNPPSPKSNPMGFYQWTILNPNWHLTAVPTQAFCRWTFFSRPPFSSLGGVKRYICLRGKSRQVQAEGWKAWEGWNIRL